MHRACDGVAVAGGSMRAGDGRTVDDEQREKTTDLKYRRGRWAQRFRVVCGALPPQIK